MKTQKITAFLVLIAVILTGCTQTPESPASGNNPATGQESNPEAEEAVLDDASNLMIDENDTVEIGEMI